MRFFVFSEKSKFDSILVPTWLHFGTQNPSKSMKKSIPRGIQKMIDFRIDFLPKLAPFWDLSWDPRAAQDGPKTSPKTLPRRHQDSPRATRASKIEIWSIFGPKVRWGTPPWPRFSRFLARLNSNFGAKFALGNLESFTSNFKIQKVNSSPNHPMSTQTSINFPSTWCPNTNFDQFSIHLRS